MTTPTGIVLVIIACITQVILLGYAWVRGQRLKTGRVWLPAILGLGTVASLAFLLPEFQIGTLAEQQFSVLLQLLALSGFGGLLTYDLLQKRGRWVVMVGGAWVILVAVVVLLVEGGGFGRPGWINASVTTGAIAPLLVVAGLVAISLYLLAVSFYVFYVSPLPEGSNRALFWAFNAMLMVTGVSLAISGNEVLAALGLGVVALSYTATTYAQVTYQVFDLRNVLALVVRLVALSTLTAVAIFSVFILIQRLNPDTVVEQTLLAGTLAILVALVYAPLRELINASVQFLIVGRKTSAVEATKLYSQEVSRAMEIAELVEIATTTLNKVLGVRKSDMLLISDTTDDGIEMRLYRRGNQLDDQLETRTIALQKSSPLYRHIAQKQAPIAQFDIEFNPDFQGMANKERAFLRSLGMSAYAPIIMDNALIGLLACGPKVNDAPIYQHDLELLIALANQTGVALRNTRLVADLRHLNASMQSLNRSLGSANERMGKLDSVKTDFITIASHELRTPLAQVRGYTDILDALNDGGMLDQDQTRGLASNLRKATERMEELISAMLDVSQLDVNAMDLRFVQTSLESVLRMAIEPLTDPVKQRKLTLSARGLSGLPSIEADMQRLVQAFRNIITNAIKFTPDGGRIDISAALHDSQAMPGTEMILVRIADTGIGINPTDLDLIFNKFYRSSDPGLHSTGAYKFMGAGPGLGLTIAKGVIEGHGGKIWVESPGHDPQTTPGSTFYIQLPLTPPEDARRVLPFADKGNAPAVEVAYDNGQSPAERSQAAE
jgi:signal transduction histidine kinase